MKIANEDITKTVFSLQLRASQEAGYKAAIHAMHSIFEANQTEAILLVDAEDAFN